MGFDEEALAEEAELQATCKRLAESYGGVFEVDRDIISPTIDEAAIYYASIETPRGEYTGEGPTLRDAMVALIMKLA